MSIPTGRLTGAPGYLAGSLSDMRITLFDLKPADGIAPGITFADPGANFAEVSAEDTGNTQSSSASGIGPFDLSVGVGLGSARAAVTGTSLANVSSLAASGSALGTLEPGGFSSFRARVTSALGDFTLTANTRVVFSAFANLNVNVDAPAIEFGAAQASVLVEGPEPDGSGFQTNGEFLFLDIGGIDFAQRFSNSDLLIASFTNLTGGNLAGQFGREAAVVGNSASVVPEPETYAMMVAGLGLLGFMLRRRARLPRSGP